MIVDNLFSPSLALISFNMREMIKAFRVAILEPDDIISKSIIKMFFVKIIQDWVEMGQIHEGLYHCEDWIRQPDAITSTLRLDIKDRPIGCFDQLIFRVTIYKSEDRSIIAVVNRHNYTDNLRVVG